MRYILFTFLLFSSLFATNRPIITGEVFTESQMFDPPERECRIFLIRHGETEWNVLGLSQGWKDIPLNEEGKKQAHTLAKALSKTSITTIIASPLSRAAETAQIIAAYHPEVTIFYDAKLRFYDPNKKKQEGKSKDEIKLEIAEEIKAECRHYLREISKKHIHENVILLTHGKVIKHLMQTLLSPEMESQVKCKVGNSQVLRVLCDGDNLVMESPITFQ